MKKILLSSAAIVAFAGAAAAEITWTGSATIGYNDDFEDGIYTDADLDVAGETALDNGLTAAFKFGFELEEIDADPAGGPASSNSEFSADSNFLLSLYNDMVGMYFGDTEFAPVSYWDGVSDMANDGFSEQDGEEVLKFSAMYGSIEGAASVAVEENDGETYGAGVGLRATFGDFWATLAYQEETSADYTDAEGDYNYNEIFGISGGATFAGADITVAYAKDGTVDEDSLGVEVAYPFGPVTLGAFYVAESGQDDDNYGVSAVYADGPIEAKVYYKSLNDNDEYGIGGAYDFGYGLVVSAGYIDGDNDGDDDLATYVVAEYDLGGGATFLASYADANSTAAELTDDIDTVTGGYELYSGATVALSFEF